MNSLTSGPSNQSFLRPLDHQETPNESQRLLSIELQHKDAPNDQGQELINQSRSNSGLNNKTSILLPPEIEMLVKEDPEGLVDQPLQAILEKEAKRWIRRNFVFCLMLVVGFWSLEFVWDNPTYLYTIIFTWCYIFWGYLLIENIIQFKDQEILLWKKVENLFIIVEIAGLILTTLAAHLNYNHVNFPVALILVPLWTNSALYVWKSQAPTGIKQCNMMVRLLYVIVYSTHVLLLTLKLYDFDSDLWLTLSFFALPFSIVMITFCLITGVICLILICWSIYLHIRKNRNRASDKIWSALGCLWLCLWSSNGYHLFEVLTTSPSDQQTILDYLIGVRNINIFFCLFTLLAYKKLKECLIKWSTDTESYRKELEKILYPERSSVMKKQVNLELRQLSSTYFTSSTSNENAQTQQDNTDKDTNNENQCYICYYEAPNAVIATCGHGGICVDCAIASVKARGQCMECRQQVQAILKIDLSSKKENAIKAIEAIVVKGEY